MLNLANELTGASFFGYYSTKIFDKVDGNGSFWTAVSGFLVFFANFIGLLSVEKIGRKSLLMIGVFLQMLCFFFMALGFNLNWQTVCISAFLMWNVCSYGGLYIVYYAYICETVPPIAIGYGFTFQYGCRTVLALIWPVMINGLSDEVIFAIFCVVVLGLFGFFWFTTIETKGKTRIEIFEEYRTLKVCCGGGGKAGKEDVRGSFRIPLFDGGSRDVKQMVEE